MRLVKNLMEEMPLMGNSPTSPQSTTLNHTHNEEVLHKPLSTTHMHTHIANNKHTHMHRREAISMQAFVNASNTHTHSLVNRRMIR